MLQNALNKKITVIINPRRACAARVTVVVLCVCACVRACVRVCVCLYVVSCHHAHLKCSPRHGKTFIIVIFTKNASFRSYGVVCLPLKPPTTHPKRRIPKKLADGWKAIDSRDFN